MASTKAPKHDFAPAWLKLQDQDNLKASGPKPPESADRSGRPRRDEFYGAYNRYPGPEYMYSGQLQRQRSFDNYYEDRRYPPPKFRHHSLEDEYYGAQYNYGYYNGYNYDRGHYRSQPALGKFPPHGLPHGPPPPPPPPPQMNGAYPPYYDPYFYEYYNGGEPFYGNHPHRPPKRHYSGDKDKSFMKTEKSDKDNLNKVKDKDTTSPIQSGNMDDEFPSLNGESETPNGKPTKGVWENSHRAKIISNNNKSSTNADPSSNSQDKDNTIRQPITTIYKQLIPSKSTVGKKTKDNKPSLAKDVNSNNHSPPKSTTVNGIFKGTTKDNKEGNVSSPTPPIEILNFVTQPRNLGDKKSDFLKALRKENTDKDAADLNVKNAGSMQKELPKENGIYEETEDVPEALVNGVDDLTMHSPTDPFLSGSFEAEQRLLKQMGWDEADEEEYTITEDEKKEFEKLLQEQQNAIRKPVLQTWSPQHLPLYKSPLPSELNDSISTSEDSGSDIE